jgi:hypothetical protein
MPTPRSRAQAKAAPGTRAVSVRQARALALGVAAALSASRNRSTAGPKRNGRSLSGAYADRSGRLQVSADSSREASSLLRAPVPRRGATGSFERLWGVGHHRFPAHAPLLRASAHPRWSANSPLRARRLGCRAHRCHGRLLGNVPKYLEQDMNGHRHSAAKLLATKTSEPRGPSSHGGIAPPLCHPSAGHGFRKARGISGSLVHDADQTNGRPCLQFPATSNV